MIIFHPLINRKEFVVVRGAECVKDIDNGTEICLELGGELGESVETACRLKEIGTEFSVIFKANVSDIVRPLVVFSGIGARYFIVDCICNPDIKEVLNAQRLVNYYMLDSKMLVVCDLEDINKCVSIDGEAIGVDGIVNRELIRYRV